MHAEQVGWQMHRRQRVRTGATTRESLQQEQDGLTSPVFHACGNTSPFRTRCCHRSRYIHHPYEQPTRRPQRLIEPVRPQSAASHLMHKITLATFRMPPPPKPTKVSQPIRRENSTALRTFAIVGEPSGNGNASGSNPPLRKKCSKMRLRSSPFAEHRTTARRGNSSSRTNSAT
jgi:hypothetical protein